MLETETDTEINYTIELSIKLEYHVEATNSEEALEYAKDSFFQDMSMLYLYDHADFTIKGQE